MIERGGTGPEWQASHRSHYQLHPDLNDELNASRAELADMSEQRDRLRQSVTLQEHRIDQQRRELARLNRLIADQRAALAADGLQFMEAERWAAAVRELEQLKRTMEAEHGRQAENRRDAVDGQPGESQDPHGR